MSDGERRKKERRRKQSLDSPQTIEANKKETHQSHSYQCFIEKQSTFKVIFQKYMYFTILKIQV